MKKNWESVLAWLLTTVICIGSINMPVYAQGKVVTVLEKDTTETSEDIIDIFSEEEITEERVEGETESVSEEEETSDIEEEMSIASEEETTEAFENNGWDGETTQQIYENENYRIIFTLSSYWETGYNANIRIENIGRETIHNWCLMFEYDGEISNTWNGNIMSHEDNKYIIKNAGWNQDILSNSYVEFGISGQTGFICFPSECKLIEKETVTDNSEYTIESKIQVEWGTGYIGSIIITNNSENTIEDWLLEFDYENTISNIWDGIIELHEGNHYVVRNAEYNHNILPGESVTIGFLVNSGSSEVIMENFVLHKYSEETEEKVPERDKEPLEDIGEAYVKEPTEDDIVIDEESGIMYVKNQLLISAYMGAERLIFEEIAQEVGAQIVGYIALTNDYQIEFTGNYSLEELSIIAEYIDSFSFVSSVSLNVVTKLEKEVTITNDTLYTDGKTCYKHYNMYDSDGDGVFDTDGTDFRIIADTWDETNPMGDNWGLEALKVLTAWDDEASFSPVKVGIYDAGFDENHEDLIFDDVVNNTTNDSEKNHGTHVAGIFAAQHDNKRGISGVATDTRLYAYACNGNSYGSSMGDKLAYATLIGNHVKVINVSLGDSQEVMFAASHPEINAEYATKAQNYIQNKADILSEYLNKLLTAGYDFVICTSAGNTNNTSFVVDTNETYGVRKANDAEKNDSAITKYSGNVLAYYDCALTAIREYNVKSRIIVVGSMKNNGSGSYKVSSFSNVGDRVDVIAPGENILSTVPITMDTLGYGIMQGTSMASPYIAGLSAMLYQVNPAIKGSLVKLYLRLGSSQSVSDETDSYPVPDAVESCGYARRAYTPNENDNPFPSGIVCGFTKDVDDNAVANVKITAIRESVGEYNLENYCFTFQSDSKGYYLQVLPQGTYSFVISKDGYLPYAINGIVINPDETTYMENIVLSKWHSLAYSGSAVQGTVKNALTGVSVNGATIKLRKGWNNKSGNYVKNILGTVRSTKTLSDGTFSLSVSVGTYTAEVSRDGYVTGYYNVISGDTGMLSPLANTTMVLTPVLADDEYRIVLTWGSTPSDLDSHLTYYVDGIQKCHVYYGRKIGTYNGEKIAQLDLDDTSSYGPETVTITLNGSLIESGKEFRYSVHNFSNRNNSSSNSLSLSNAMVQVYAGNEKVKTFNVPKNVVGTVWHVFDITEEGIKSVNEFYNESSAAGVK